MSSFIINGRMEVVRLDDLLLCPSPITFGLLKMDVEGFEWKIIQGGERFFRCAHIPFIVMEIRNLRKEDWMATFDFLHPWGTRLIQTPLLVTKR